MSDSDLPQHKLKTGISGFDHISDGGLPSERSTLICGTSGSGKTVFALQFLLSGIAKFSEPGVLVACEEAPKDLLQNVGSFSWSAALASRRDLLGIVDATPSVEDETVEAGTYDLSALTIRIEAAVRSLGAKRVVIDSVGALFPQFRDANVVRRELHRIASRLRDLGATTVITMERVAEDGSIGRFGIEEFVADSVVVMRNRLEGERRRRTVEILKLRGAAHYKGEYPFTIDPEEGITIIPLSAIQLAQKSDRGRTSSGVPELDEMCGGGLYSHSVNLISGATGTGKTLLVTHFLDAAIQRGERALLFATEEGREQLTRNAAAWGVNFARAEESGLLRIVCRLPETMGLEDHLIHMRRDIAIHNPSRVVVDSMTAMERASTHKSFREFFIGLTTNFKHLGITGLLTTASSMLAVESSTEVHISTMTDTIILLRYVELHGELRRGIVVLKMRGTRHERAIREYTIDELGMRVMAPFRNIHGILGGTPTYMFSDQQATTSHRASLNSFAG